MCANVTQRTAAGHRLVEAPSHWKFDTHRPVLGVTGINMKDSSQPAVTNQLGCQRGSRRKLVRVTATMSDAGPGSGLKHQFGIRKAIGQRLFTKYVFAMTRSFDRYIAMQVSRGGDTDQIDILTT